MLRWTIPILLLSLSASSNAKSLVEEPFDYADRAAMTSAGWKSLGPEIAPLELAEDGLSVPGLKPGTGRRLTIPASDKNVEAVAREFPNGGNDLFVSFAIRVGGVGKLDDKFDALLRLDGGGDKPVNGVGLFIRLNAEDASTFDLGMHKRSNGNEVQSAPALQKLPTGKVLFIVLRYDPAGGDPDRASIWINPDPSSFRKDAAPEPTFSTPSKNRISWDDCLNRYVGGNYTDAELLDDRPVRPIRVFQCPSDTLQRGISATYLDQQIRTYSVAAPFVFGSYSSLSVNFLGAFMRAPIPGNAPLSHTDPLPVGFRCFRLNDLKPGSGVLLLVEQPHVQSILGHVTMADCRTGTAQFTGVKVPLHDRRYNYLFNDGHVEKLQVHETLGTGTLDMPRGMWTRAADD